MNRLQLVGSPNFVRGTAKPQISGTGLAVRLALDDQTRADAYAIRHASYLSGGFIDPMPGGIFTDADDHKPGSRSVVIYKKGRPVASARLCTLDFDLNRAPLGEIPASRIFPKAVAELVAGVSHDRPVKITEINRLVRHPDFATDYLLVFVLFRIVGFLLSEEQSDMTLSCVRRNHMPFYKRMHFEYIAGPRKYAGVKFETSLMSCFNSQYDAVAKDLPIIGEATGPTNTYAGLLQGETVNVFAEG